MENLHDKQPKLSDRVAVRENTVYNTAEALKKVSKEFHELVTYADPEELHRVTWDMFQTYLMANANDCLPEDIYTYTLVYESLRNICKEMENIPQVPCNRFKVIYEFQPPSES